MTKLNLISKILIEIIIVLVVVYIVAYFGFKNYDNKCVILRGENTDYEDCWKIDEEYCKKINCTFTRWNCGAPACRCY